MNLDAFIAQRRPSWDELDALLEAAKGRPERLGAQRMRRLGELYRGAAADLALARRRFPAEPTVPALEDLVGRAHAVVYGTSVRRESAREFLSHGYWRRIRERPALLAVSALLLFGPALVGGLWAWNDPGSAGALVPSTSEAVARPRPEGSDLGLSRGERASFSAGIFTNNIRVTFAAVAGGISFGLLTAGVLLFNGALIGVVVGLGVAAGNGSVMLELIVPHGVLELSCIVVAGAAGLRIGWALVDPGRRPRGQALAAEARAAVELALGTALWLVVAGLTEGLVTPLGIGVGPALAVGLGLAAVYWALGWRLGRPRPAVTGGPGTSP
ncbi:MAG TPA: stage II sporulation protein M [Acidimicrobiales bacterium]|nr:stage II sporulation protein M [Acidimicrobiales bacterium]